MLPRVPCQRGLFATAFVRRIPGIRGICEKGLLRVFLSEFYVGCASFLHTHMSGCDILTKTLKCVWHISTNLVSIKMILRSFKAPTLTWLTAKKITSQTPLVHHQQSSEARHNVLAAAPCHVLCSPSRLRQTDHPESTLGHTKWRPA